MASLLVALLAMVSAVGWFVVDSLAAERDVQNGRLESRVEFLIESYRSIFDGFKRECLTEEQKLRFEAAITDIYLLGSADQIDKVKVQLDKVLQGKEPEWGVVLVALREDLRQELKMPAESGSVMFHRLARTETDC